MIFAFLSPSPCFAPVDAQPKVRTARSSSKGYGGGGGGPDPLISKTMLPICSLRGAAFQRLRTAAPWLRAAAPWLRERRGPQATTRCVAFRPTSPDPHVFLVIRCSYYSRALDSRAEISNRWIDHEHMTIKLVFEQWKRRLMALARHSFLPQRFGFDELVLGGVGAVPDFFMVCIRVIFLIYRS